MIRFRAFKHPKATCKDASLAVQSDLQDTLIPEIMKKFAHDPSVLMVNNPANRVVGDYPESFQDNANLLTQIRSFYHAEASTNADLSFDQFTENLLRLASEQGGAESPDFETNRNQGEVHNSDGSGNTSSASVGSPDPNEGSNK